MDLTPSFLFLPMQSNLLDDLRRLLDRSVSHALSDAELEQVRAAARLNGSFGPILRATKR